MLTNQNSPFYFHHYRKLYTNFINILPLKAIFFTKKPISEFHSFLKKLALKAFRLILRARRTPNITCTNF